jgi:methionine-rich copper-binding protein CopC
MTSHHAVLAAAALAAAWGAPALAHTGLEQATIEDDSEIAAAPESLSMTFGEPVALAGVTLTVDGGAEIPLDFTPSPEPAATFTVPLPALEPARYDLTWRALGDAIDFTVTGAAQGMHPSSPAELHDNAHGTMHDSAHEGSGGEHAEH